MRWIFVDLPLIIIWAVWVCPLFSNSLGLEPDTAPHMWFMFLSSLVVGAAISTVSKKIWGK